MGPHSRFQKVLNWLDSNPEIVRRIMVRNGLLGRIRIRWHLQQNANIFSLEDIVRIRRLLPGEARILARACNELGFAWKAYDHNSKEL